MQTYFLYTNCIFAISCLRNSVGSCTRKWSILRKFILRGFSLADPNFVSDSWQGMRILLVTPEAKFTASALCPTFASKEWTLNFNYFYPSTLLILTLIKKKIRNAYLLYFCLEIKFIRECKHVKTEFNYYFQNDFLNLLQNFIFQRRWINWIIFPVHNR